MARIPTSRRRFPFSKGRSNLQRRMARRHLTAWSFRRPSPEDHHAASFWCYAWLREGRHHIGLEGTPPRATLIPQVSLQLQLICNPDRARVLRRSKQRVRGLERHTRCSSERWQSGRLRQSRKLLYLNGFREFESPPLRHSSRPPFPIKQSQFQHAGSDGEGAPGIESANARK